MTILQIIRNRLLRANWTIGNITDSSFDATNSQGATYLFKDLAQPIRVWELPEKGMIGFYEQTAKHNEFCRSNNCINVKIGNCRDAYNLPFSISQSRLFINADSNSFAITIGNIEDDEWNCIYGGAYHNPLDSSVSIIGMADCRLNMHEVSYAAHDNKPWDCVASRFDVSRGSIGYSATRQYESDNFLSADYVAPIHGLCDYFTTYSFSPQTTSSLAKNNIYKQDKYNMWYKFPYVGITDCAYMLPAFYLEGRANENDYAVSGNLSPQLYYRGDLPFLYTGGNSYPAGIIFEDQQGIRYLSTGNIGRLSMRLE